MAELQGPRMATRGEAIGVGLGHGRRAGIELFRAFGPFCSRVALGAWLRGSQPVCQEREHRAE